jgi:HSP20 family protein
MSLMTRPGRGMGRAMGAPWRWSSSSLWPEMADRWPAGWPDRWFDRLFDGDSMTEGAMIHVEEFVEDGTFVMRAELPGIDPDRDVEITVTDDQVRLRAERRIEEYEHDRQGYRTEFRYGSLRRTIPLPVGSQADQVHASYRDGILEVRLPLGTVSSEGHKVPISRE